MDWNKLYPTLFSNSPYISNYQCLFVTSTFFTIWKNVSKEFIDIQEIFDHTNYVTKCVTKNNCSTRQIQGIIKRPRSPRIRTPNHFAST